MSSVSIIGCGFVADLYMRSLRLYPHVRVVAVHDRDPARARAFCAHWGLDAPQDTLEGFLAAQPAGTLVLNLTNPDQHVAVSRACLAAGHPVYSEKPMAMQLEEVQRLHGQARDAGLTLASAPCSVLGRCAQTLGRALRAGVGGTPRLVYAELDDGFIPQAPFRDWRSPSGAPWPYADEFATGCTLEHAGYYLAWLIAFFGPVAQLAAMAAEVIPDKPGGGATPDVSVAVLSFESGLVARLTCSIVAPHDHGLQVIGDAGVLRVARAWDNAAPVRFHRRMRLRRRLIDLPFGRRVPAPSPSHPMVSRQGAAAMNFALGPIEVLEAIDAGRASRLGGDYALHLNEVTLAIQEAGPKGATREIASRCAPMEPMPWAR